MKPPFSINNNMLNKIVEISKAIGNLEFQVERNLKLRKENRIKSIHSSLAIENNSLTVEQITDIIDGKRVLGNPKEIHEVKNAYDAYEEILTLNPYKQSDFLRAYGLLTNGIINASGQYRPKDVGIYDSAGNLIHMGARPQFITSLMSDLFDWGANDDTPELIKSCVFHYEIETVHPFEDGNGRMGRLWQTVILANWNSIFAWIPIETIIYENQQAYYDALAIADSQNDSSGFVEFMLSIILETLIAYKTSDKSSDKISEELPTELSGIELQVYLLIKKYLTDHDTINTAVATKLLGKSAPTVRKHLSSLVSLGFLEAHGSNKNRTYSLKK
ncbi:Fic family protein [Pseudolactococcus yaeyamensis]